MYSPLSAALGSSTTRAVEQLEGIPEALAQGFVRGVNLQALLEGVRRALVVLEVKQREALRTAQATVLRQ
jgi:hypothetical protein